MDGTNRWLRGEKVPPEPGDGFLLAEEVSALELTGTEMVVLSACDTGLANLRPVKAYVGFDALSN